jgi:AraC-like DNA-binding protein
MENFVQFVSVGKQLEWTILAKRWIFFPKMKLPALARDVGVSRYAHFGVPLRTPAGLRVLLAGREACLPGYRVQRAGFSCYGVEFVAEGAGRVTLDGRAHPLFPGVLFCYGPKTVQDIVTDPERPLTKYFADFLGGEVPGLLRRNGLRPGTAVQVAEVETPRFFFEQLIRRDEADEAAARETAALCLRLILLRARRAVSPSRPRESAARFARWRAYLDEHALRLHNLEELAAELGTRPGQICRVFQEAGQPRPFQYLTRRKLDRAVELLVVGGSSVKEAAAAVGYDDPYHFSRLFKHHFGRSPSQFLREASRADEG